MTLRLLNLAARHWDTFDGWCREIDPWNLPAHRMLSFIYHWATEGAGEDEIRKFDMRLWIPPPEEKDKPITEGPWTAEAETAAFRGLAADLNVKPG